MKISRIDVNTVIIPTNKSPPNNCKVVLQATCTKKLVPCIIKFAVPNFIIDFVISHLILICCKCRRRLACLENKNFNTQQQEKNCEIIVAKAAPATPISITKIKIGSKIIFVIAPIIIDNIPILGKPCALIYPFIPEVIIEKIVPNK